MDKIILCNCQLTPSHGWMAFSLWYSIYKRIPDAQLVIVAERSAGSMESFGWTRKVKVPFLLGKRTIKSFIELPPAAIVARELTDPPEVADCRSLEMPTFVTYFNGVGKFVVDNRIDTLAAPFENATKYSTPNLTANERAILSHWDQMNNVVALM
jgi:hypothetical protein